MILLIFVLVSCNIVPQGDTPDSSAVALKAVQTGTDGVSVSFITNYPPATVYDQNELVAMIELQNKGNHDLSPTDCFVQITGFDPNIIRGGLSTVKTCAEGIGTLEGKNVYNTDGGRNQLEFSSSSIQLPQGVFEYNPKLNVVTCYHYQTKASPSVCVDPLFFQVSAEQKTCKPVNVGLSGGQGAPVGVSNVGVNMVGRRAIFEITVQKYGTGRVLSPSTDIRNCGQASLKYEDLDKVGFNVQLSGGNLIDCKPTDRTVRLNNNQGKIVCSFNIAGASAYETPLIIQLDYGYVQSFSRNVKIVKTPQ